MLKIGKVLVNDNRGFTGEYSIVYSQKVGFNRIDILTDINDFDEYNSSKAISSYISKNKEYFKGNESLIVGVQKAIAYCSGPIGQKKNEFKSDNGQLIFSTIKTDEKTGMEQRIKTINGAVVEEYYNFDGFTVHFDTIDKSIDLNEPYNIVEYTTNNMVDESELSDSFGDAEYYSWEYLKAKYGEKVAHLDDYDMLVADSEEIMLSRIKEFDEAISEFKSVDTEDTGLDVGLFGEDCITGIVLSYSETWSTYIPFRQEGCEWNAPIKYIQYIVDVINRQPKSTKICMYNGPFDKEAFRKEQWQFIKHCDYAMKWDKEPCMTNNNTDVRMDIDGLRLSIKLEQIRKRGYNSLKGRAEQITGLFWLELNLIFKGKIRFNVLPPELIKYYACPDTMNTIRVIKHMLKLFPTQELGVLELENEVQDSVVDCEFFGLNTDVKKLDELILDTEYACDRLESEFKKIHRISSNIRSNKTKLDIFYNKLRAPIDVRTKNGGPSASNVALKRILERGELPKDKISEEVTPDIVGRSKKRINEETGLEEEYREVILQGKDLKSNKYPSLVILQKYTKLRKELGALRRIKNNSKRGRTKFYLNSDGADSDRMTSDAHQYSDTMKSVIIADSKYHNLVSSDWSQVELRILSYEAEEEDLIKLENNPSIDVHRAFLNRIEGVPIHMITNEMRKDGKATNFGVVYDMSEYGLAHSRKGAVYSQEDLVKAKNDITNFYNALVGVKHYKEESRRLVMRDHKISTRFGFIRYFDYLDDPGVTKTQIEKAKKAANNTRIQSFGATMLKISMTKYKKYIKAKGWDQIKEYDGVPLPMVRLMLPIHDEVLISYDKTAIRAEEILLMCKECQELEIKGAPKFFAPPAIVDNWYMGKNDAYEIPVLFRDQIVEQYKKDPSVVLLDMNNYLESINKYRYNLLKNYMDGLVEKYKTPEEVAIHVDHPELTHSLISSKLGKDTKLFKTQEERILESCKRYMEGISIEEVSSAEEDLDEVPFYLKEDEFITQFMRFDDKGELITDDLDEDADLLEEGEEDDLDNIIEFIPETIQKVKNEWVFYAMSECVIMFYGLNIKTQGEEIHQNLKKYYQKGGPYKVVYSINNKLVPTDYTIGYIPDDINKEFEKVLQEEDECDFRIC